MLRREYLPMAVALLVSLLAHALVFRGYRQGAVLRPARPAPATVPVITFLAVDDAPAPVTVPRPRAFVETDDRQVTGEMPAATPFYSDRDTVAANPDNPSGQLGDTPYLAGKEARGHSTEDVPRQGPAAAPAPPAAPAAPPTPTKTEPAPPAAVGSRVVELAPPSAAPAPPAAPATAGAPVERELAARKTQLTASGVAHIGVAAFNVAASPFGEYDKKIVRAVQSRWFALIDRNDLFERSGTVTVQFELHRDGAVRALRRQENSAGEILALFCEKAILESAPFDPFPERLQVLVGTEPRTVNFTFYY